MVPTGTQYRGRQITVLPQTVHSRSAFLIKPICFYLTFFFSQRPGLNWILNDPEPIEQSLLPYSQTQCLLKCHKYAGSWVIFSIDNASAVESLGFPRGNVGRLQEGIWQEWDGVCTMEHTIYYRKPLETKREQESQKKKILFYFTWHSQNSGFLWRFKGAILPKL